MRGVPPFPNVPPGYRRRKDGTPRAGPEARDRGRRGVPAARRRRDRDGGSRAPVAGNGIERSFHGVQSLLAVADPARRAPVRRDRERARARGDRRRGHVATGAAADRRRAAAARSRSGCWLGSACCVAAPAARGWSPARRCRDDVASRTRSTAAPPTSDCPQTGDDQRRRRRGDRRSRR